MEIGHEETKGCVHFPPSHLRKDALFKSTSLLGPFNLPSHLGSTHYVHCPHKAIEKCHVVGVSRISWFPVEHNALSTVTLLIPQTTQNP